MKIELHDGVPGQITICLFSSLFYRKVREFNTVSKCNFYACEPTFIAYRIICLEKTDQPGYGLQNSQSINFCLTKVPRLPEDSLTTLCAFA